MVLSRNPLICVTEFIKLDFLKEFVHGSVLFSQGAFTRAVRSLCFWIYENEFTDRGDRSLRLHGDHDASYRWDDIEDIHRFLKDLYRYSIVNPIYEMYRDLYAVEGFDLRDL